MPMRFIIQAPNIHCGGGFILLREILNVLPKGSLLFVDTRLSLTNKELDDFEVIRVTPSIFWRLQVEFKLYKKAKAEDIVICFGNLPSLLRLDAKTILFLQNRTLVDKYIAMNISLRLKVRTLIERFWLKRFHRNVDSIIVQTTTMKKLVLKSLHRDSYILPFIQLMKDESIGFHHPLAKKYDFIYVASGESHKNHYKLIEAWIELAKIGYFPSLCLTISFSEFPTLCKYIDQSVNDFQLNIKNLGEGTSEKIMELYQKTHALIFPSIIESFGLPLIEAHNAGLSIIASELDYVRDVVQPVETFDPNSAISIMRAVSRFMHYENQKYSLLDARQFLDKVINL